MSKKKTSRMGRPPKPKGMAKDVQIVVRLTPAFHKALLAAAAAEGNSVAGYVRDTVAEKIGWRE
ncbi:MAG: toxin-antitoxin system HicB family antitoxin [Phycisphaerae bacterium]|nr:toxin-antitoxin system HicB family antitoxin [Phycisphaerae bacterium]